jgi:signal transduction histidine kinase
MSAKPILSATSADEVKTAIASLGSATPALLEEIALEALRLRGEVKTATRAREVLLASVAHDLRNPLNTFAMSTGLLRDDIESPQFERARALSLVSRMERASTRMQRLIEDLLEASRIEAGNIELAVKAEDAAGVLRSAIEKAKPLAQDKGATVEEDAATEGLLLIKADKARAVEALTKLVTVALKSTGEGGVIRLGVEKRDAKIVFLVRGIAPRQTKSAAPDESRGGLALLIARGLVTAHGGTIATETTNEGARTLAIFDAV